MLRGGNSRLGFYYDFFFEPAINPEYLPQIEERYRALVMADLPVAHATMMKQNAQEMYRHFGQEIRADLFEEERAQFVEMFKCGEFFDAAPLPYVASTRELSAYKLLSLKIITQVIGGEEIQVTRIEGVAAFDKQALKQEVRLAGEAKARDHMQLGLQQQLFARHPYLAPGTFLWLPKGAQLREGLLDWWRTVHLAAGFQTVHTPLLLEEQAGKLGQTISQLDSLEVGGSYYHLVQSMAPQHAMIFQAKLRRAGELPYKICEYREIFTGIADHELEGLCQTRTICRDQATVFCTPEQVVDGLISSLQFIAGTIRIFDLKCKWALYSATSLKAGKTADWKRSVEWFHKALHANKMDFVESQTQQELHSPFLEVVYSDALGREWPGPRIEIFLQLPSRMRLVYEAKQGQHTPIMISWSLFGSLERFIALLIEHHAGILPEWMTKKKIPESL